MFQCLNHLHGPLLYQIQYVPVSLILGSSALDSTLQMCLSSAEQSERVSSLSLLAMLCLIQNATGFLCCEGTLLVHWQSVICQHTKVHLCRTAFQMVSPEPVLEHGVILPQGQTGHFTLWNFMRLLSVLPLNDSTPIWCIIHFSQFYIISKIAEGAPCPNAQGINENVTQYWPQYWSLGCTANDWSLTGLCASDDKPLNPTTQPVLSPSKCALT